MAHTLTVLFRRDPGRDRFHNQVPLVGYQMFWPDGKPVAMAHDAFCRHGQRLFGLGRHLAGCEERLVELVCYRLSGIEDELTRRKGYRLRRFYVERNGTTGRIHFHDGTPTAVTFRIDRDDPDVLEWIGLAGLPDGDRRWIDLGAAAV
jgi:hypothetical protein